MLILSLWLADLELAAEIGKNLLERNKELEVMLKSSHQYLEEQSVKNEVGKRINGALFAPELGSAVCQKSRNYSGLFRVPQ